MLENSKMDSVFDSAEKDAVAFDIMFDEDDSLIDTVNGVNEAGDPLTGADVIEVKQSEDKDISNDVNKDAEGKSEAKVLDTSVTNTELNKKSDADEFHGDAEKDYQEDKGVTKEADPEDIAATVDKAVESVDIEAILGEDADYCDDNQCCDSDPKNVCPTCGGDGCPECKEDGAPVAPVETPTVTDPQECTDDDNVQTPSYDDDDEDIALAMGEGIDIETILGEKAATEKEIVDDDKEDEDIDEVEDMKDKKVKKGLDYEYEDEELIDIALNGK